MRKCKYLKSILAGLNKKKIILKNPSNWPPLVNVIGLNIKELR